MSKYFLISLIAALIGAIHSVSAQPKIIFDTDFGGDADDLGALTMLHHYIDQDKCDLLGIMIWSTEKYAVPAVDAVNRYYDHPDIPIGVRKDNVHETDWNYTKPLADAFPHQMRFEDAPDATQLYRKILAGEKDNSVTIVTVGPLKNIQNLIESEPDEISLLNGKELIAKKVKEFVIMGGKFPEGEGEWNFDGGMKGVTKFVVDNLEVPVVFSGFELGVQIKTGKAFNKIDPESPLYIGFKHFSENAPWMKENYMGQILDNASYDQTAVLYAVEGGIGKYWKKVVGGHIEVAENGDNKWIKGKRSHQSYLKLIAEPEQLAEIIEKRMLGEIKK